MTGQPLIRTCYILIAISMSLYSLSACTQTHLPESTMLDTLLSSMRPWCIGRFVIDRPVDSALGNQRYMYRDDKLETVRNVSPEMFRKRVAEREQELRSKIRTDTTKMNASTGIPWLQQAVSPTPNSRLLIFRDSEISAIQLPFDAEGYVLAGHNMFILRSLAYAGYVQKYIDSRTERYKGIHYRDDWTVPDSPGFCFDGGLIDAEGKNEEVDQSFALLPGKPAGFSISMRAAVDMDLKESLIRRLPDLRRRAEQIGGGGHLSVLREGRRQLAGMEAEEVLFEISDGPEKVYQFYLVAPGKPDFVAQPHTEIQMGLGDAPTSFRTKEQTVSPVDEAGAIKLWDTLLDSMRLRPGAVR